MAESLSTFASAVWTALPAWKELEAALDNHAKPQEDHIEVWNGVIAAVVPLEEHNRRVALKEERRLRRIRAQEKRAQRKKAPAPPSSALPPQKRRVGESERVEEGQADVPVKRRRGNKSHKIVDRLSSRSISEVSQN